jgi:release factor glutamine methyltransferase
VTSARDLIRLGQERLGDCGSSTPRLDAELLLGHVLGLDRTRLLASLNVPVDPASADGFFELVEQRSCGVPVAYLTGHRAFHEIDLLVGPGALVPRPETELLVEWSIERMSTWPDRASRLVVDVGTGSGAIALAIAANFRDETPHIIASDISAQALAWAQRNRDRSGLSSSVDFVRGDLLRWLGRRADLVLANLPYLRPDQVDGSWELSAEPRAALVSGEDGLDGIRSLRADLPRVLAPGGSAAFEIDPSQADEVRQLLAHGLRGARVDVLLDLAGEARVVTVTMPDPVDLRETV